MSADESQDANERAALNPKPGRLSQRDRERIQELHEAGASDDEIAEALQRTTGLVQKTLAGDPPGPSKVPKKKKTAPPARRRAAEPGAAAPTPARPPRLARDTSLRHVFWLRAQTLIELELPADLRGDEAQRLANYLQTLPFGVNPR